MATYTRQQLDNIRIARSAAKRAGIDPNIFQRQMKQEANFGDPTSPAGAQGPAQIMPATAAGWGVKNVHDPHEAYGAAATNMAKYLKQYGGSWSKALTAYNAGPGRVGGALPAETTNYISTILGGSDPAPKAAAKTYGITTPGKAPTLTPGSEKTDTKGAVTAALLDKRKGMSLVSRMQEAISSGQYTTTTLPKVTPGTAPKYSVGSAQGASAASGGGDAKARADAIDAKKLPYKWGGGHGGKVNPATASPLDCSGAVSAVLGLNPRVASQFKTWGKAGDGGSKGVTVYAKDTHVLMKINGHFWGTSGSNPGGGAGWIKQKDISPSYLAGFTARHQ